MNIWLLVALSVALVLGCILIGRLHAFLTLLLAGLLVAALAGEQTLWKYTEFQVEQGKLTQEQATKLQSQRAVTRLATAFGETVGKIGILIALASIIGQCLLESGAASVIVDRMLQLTGPRRAPEALAASSFVLGIPVFFDTVFYLMVPLARSLRERLGKDYVLFILAILAGGSIAHSLVPPTPGPLLVAEIIGVDIGTMIIAGLIIGGCSSVVSLGIARIINRMIDVPLRFTDDAPAGGQDSADRMPEVSSNLCVDRPCFDRCFRSRSPSRLIAVGSVAAYLIDSGRNSKQHGNRHHPKPWRQEHRPGCRSDLCAVANEVLPAGNTRLTGQPFVGLGRQHHSDHGGGRRLWCHAPPSRDRGSGWFVGARCSRIDAAAARLCRHRGHSNTARFGDGCHDYRGRRAARIRAARNTPVSSGLHGNGHWRRQQAGLLDDR